MFYDELLPNKPILGQSLPILFQLLYKMAATMGEDEPEVKRAKEGSLQDKQITIQFKNENGEKRLSVH